MRYSNVLIVLMLAGCAHSVEGGKAGTPRDDGGSTATPTPPPASGCDSDSDERDGRTDDCDAPPPPTECASGEAVPGRIIELKVPAPRWVSTDLLGHPMQANFQPFRGGSDSVFVQGGRIRKQRTNESRPDYIDFDGKHERDAHVKFCAELEGADPAGGRENGTLGTEGCAGIGVGFVNESRRAYSYNALHLIDSREYVYVDDIQSDFDWGNVPPEATWYIHSIEFGYSLDLTSWSAMGSDNLGFDLGLSYRFEDRAPSPSPEDPEVDKKDAAPAPAPPMMDPEGGFDLESFELGVGFRNYAMDAGATLSAVLRGFVPTTEDCFWATTPEEFRECWTPAAHPVPIMMTLRNIPRRCMPEDERLERDWPVQATVRFSNIEVLASGEDTASWALEPVCEVEGVDLGSHLGARSFTIDGVEPCSGEACYAPDGRVNPVLVAGVSPGQTLRCGVSGRAINAGLAGAPIHYAEFVMDIPDFAGDSDVHEGTFEQTTVGGNHYRVHYTVELDRFE